MKFNIASFVVTIIWSTVTFAQGNWQGIPWGATIEQVSASSKVPLERLEQTKPARVGDLYTAFRIRSYQVGAYRYLVRLNMRASETDGLAAVTLAPEGASGLDDYTIRVQAAQLEQLLTERYGQPAFKNTERGSGPFGDTNQRSWITPDARIQLYWTVGLMKNIGLSYMPPSSGDASKL